MLARGGDFFRAQRCAVGFVAALFGCRAFANQRFAADDGGFARFGLRGGDGGADGIGVVSVHIGHDMPAVASKALRDVFGEPAIHFAVNGNIVIVI